MVGQIAWPHRAVKPQDRATTRQRRGGLTPKARACSQVPHPLPCQGLLLGFGPGCARAQKRVQLPTSCPTTSPTEMDQVSPRPDTALLDAAREVSIRQELTLVALGRRKADKVLRVGRLLDVHTGTWQTDWEIVIKGARIAWVGPAGVYEGEGASGA